MTVALPAYAESNECGDFKSPKCDLGWNDINAQVVAKETRIKPVYKDSCGCGSIPAYMVGTMECYVKSEETENGNPVLICGDCPAFPGEIYCNEHPEHDVEEQMLTSCQYVVGYVSEDPGGQDQRRFTGSFGGTCEGSYGGEYPYHDHAKVEQGFGWRQDATEVGLRRGGERDIKLFFISPRFFCCDDEDQNGAFELMDTKSDTVTIETCKDKGCGGGRCGGFADSLFAFGGIPESCCNKTPALRLGNLEFTADSGVESARGISLKYLASDIGAAGVGRSQDIASFILPGRNRINNIAIGSGSLLSPWNYAQTNTDWTYFEAKVTDDLDYTYVFHAVGTNGMLVGTNGAPTVASDWEGFEIPCQQVLDENDAVIRVYESELIPGISEVKWRITKQRNVSGDQYLTYTYSTADPEKLIKVESSTGRSIELEYDDHYRLVSYQHGTGGCSGCGQGQVFEYQTFEAENSMNDIVIRREDLGGNVLAIYDYDSEGRLTRIGRGAVDSNGIPAVLAREIEYTTGSNGLDTIEYRFYVNNDSYEKVVEVERATGVVGKRIEFTGLYDSSGGCISASCDSCTTGFSQATSPPREMTEYPRGNFMVEELSENSEYRGSVIKSYRSTDGSDSAMIEEFTYTTVANQQQIFTSTNMYGGVTYFWYDLTDRPLVTKRWDPVLTDAVPSTAWAETVYTYHNKIDRVKTETVTAPDGSTTETTFAYDDNDGADANAPGNLASQIEDDGGLDLKTQYFYNANNELTKTADPRGVVRRMVYDDSGRMVQQYTLETLSLSGAESGNALEETLQEFDANGRMQFTFVRDTNQPFAPHNVAGGYPTTSSSDWVVTEHEYDVYGRRTATIVDPDGLNLQTEFTYDHQNRIVRTTTPGGVWTEIVRDGKGQQIEERMGSGSTVFLTTTYEYDCNGNMTQLVEPSGRTITYEYDMFDRRTKMTRD
jgi:YD repeat-containing protein